MSEGHRGPRMGILWGCGDAKAKALAYLILIFRGLKAPAPSEKANEPGR